MNALANNPSEQEPGPFDELLNHNEQFTESRRTLLATRRRILKKIVAALHKKSPKTNPAGTVEVAKESA